MTAAKLSTALVLQPLPEAGLASLRSFFNTVHSYPDASSPPPESVLAESEVLLMPGSGFPKYLTSLDQVPKVQHIQLTSAGSNNLVKSEHVKTPAAQDRMKAGELSLATSSGIHVESIPNYVVACIISLWHQLPRQIEIARNERRWAKGTEVDAKGQTYYARRTMGRTAGMLGYGALGRETARLLKAHGMRIIAANTSGKATEDNSYAVPGTGDKSGALPEKYYSTKSPESLEAFLKECDVIVGSMPSTPQTQYMLDAKKLELLKPEAVFVNIGRGDLIKSDELLAALDSKTNPLFGAAIDVTDPEPLPDNHPLYTHPKVILTPHLSGDTEGEMEIAVQVLIANVEKKRQGEGVLNEVNLIRGY